MAKTLETLLAEETPEFIKEAKAKANTMRLNINLAKLRQLTHYTQNDIAQFLELKQPTIANMEKSGHDLRLSSLKKYIEAMNGKVSIQIEMPNGKNIDIKL